MTCSLILRIIMMNESWVSEERTLQQPVSGFPLKRISWSAVFAGVITALIIQILLGLLGTAIGATVIDPLQEQDPLHHMATGTLIWVGLSMIISIAGGSYIAGRLAQREGALHGLMMFGLATLITLWLAVSMATGIIGGAFNVLGAGASALGKGISAIAPSVTSLAKDKLRQKINSGKIVLTLMSCRMNCRPPFCRRVSLNFSRATYRMKPDRN